MEAVTTPEMKVAGTLARRFVSEEASSFPVGRGTRLAALLNGLKRHWLTSRANAIFS